MIDDRNKALISLLLFTLTGCSTQETGGSWQIWAWIVILITLTAATLLFISAIVSWQKRTASVRYRLALHNAGNIASQYALQAEAPTGELSFVFLLRGVEMLGGTAAKVDSSTSREELNPPTLQRPNFKKSKGLLSLASTGAGILISLGNLLPYNVGVHLIRIGSKLRRGQGAAQRVGRVSGQVSRQSGKIRGGSNARSGTARPPVSTVLPTPSWVKTPQLMPGEKLNLELLVQPENPYRAQRSLFVLRSRSLEQENTQASQPNVVRQEIELDGLTPFQKYSPFLLLLMGIIGILITALFLIHN